MWWLPLVAAVACTGAPEEALERGDRLYGAGRVEEAVAEYKLALRQRGEDPGVLLRLGAAYAHRGEVDAGLRYLRPLTKDPTTRVQAAADLAEAARTARDEGAPDNMARALAPVEKIGLGFVPEDLRLPLARYYAGRGEYERALPLYLVVAEVDSVPPAVWHETARAFQELGACREAIGYFERFLGTRGARQSDRSTARWQYGTCLFQVAQQEIELGRPRSAIAYLDALIEQGVPRTLLDRAHFAKAEILFADGERDAARSEYEAVLQLNPARTGPLVQMAEERLREIRYGFSAP